MKNITAAVNRSLLYQTLLFVILTDASVILNIPFLRQFSGFLFLTLVPGYLILQMLKLNKLGLVEKFVLSVGLSIAFDMLFGLIFNFLVLATGYTRPLSTMPILISFSAAALGLAALAARLNKDSAFSLPNLNFSVKEKALLILPALFPLMSVVGMRIMNLQDNNALLMGLLLSIPAFIVFTSFYRKHFPQRLYPIITYLIGISLLIMLPLRTNHIIGSDAHSMYYLFQTTLGAGHWGLFTRGLMDATISISLLPAIYHIYLGINTERLITTLYPVIFSIAPLVVYIISSKYVGSYYGLIASFFFMAQFVFLWTAGSGNTNMAILFFALAIMALFQNDLNEFARKLLFILFAISAILSHYSSSYIFFFLLLLTWAGMKILPRIVYRRKNAPKEKESASESTNSRSAATTVSITMITLFFVFLFVWYSQITIAPFDYGVGFIRETFLSLPRWFILESRGSTIVAATGENIITAPQEIRLIVSWLTVILTGIGVLGTMARHKIMVVNPDYDDGRNKPEFLQKRFEPDFLILSMACSSLLVLTAALPFVSRGYSMERTYSQAMAVISLFFCIGGITLSNWIRVASHWIILIVLIPFFMSTTGAMYQLLGYPASLMLNSRGAEYERLYMQDEDSYAAKWIIKHKQEDLTVFPSGIQGSNTLVSQGGVPYWQVKDSFTLAKPSRIASGYLFLRRSDTTFAKVTTAHSGIFAPRSRIYTAGGAEIYR